MGNGMDLDRRCTFRANGCRRDAGTNGRFAPCVNPSAPPGIHPMFVDYAKITVQAGEGGDGCVSFRREKYVPRGGPDGGDGGRGGHVWFVVDEHMATLLDIKTRPVFAAPRGRHGGGNQCSGRDGEDIEVRLPLGTVISGEDGEELADLTAPGTRWMAAEGGHGGKGNQHFASSTNKAPRKFSHGGDGQSRKLILELKVIADIGLVGLPNAGKSTLLAALTKATPKVGAYPFTTLSPNLGVLDFDDHSRCVLADIPGLIEGAHHGAGLGDRFLRHVERTRLLAHLVAPPEDPEEAAEDLATAIEHFRYAWRLVNEELRQYGGTLADKRQIVVVTKTDLLPPATVEAALAEFRGMGHTALAISSHDGGGLTELTATLRAALEEMEGPSLFRGGFDDAGGGGGAPGAPTNPAAPAGQAGEAGQAPASSTATLD